jgi:hypothetical protein
MIFRSFPQENEKNIRVPLIRVNLISGTLMTNHERFTFMAGKHRRSCGLIKRLL